MQSHEAQEQSPELGGAQQISGEVDASPIRWIATTSILLLPTERSGQDGTAQLHPHTR